jgi:ribosome-binding factor A
MSRKRTQTRNLLASAAELSSEDGTDPKAFHEKPWNQPRSAGRKARQLCDQVANALRGILADSADDAIRSLAVVQVEPAPNTGRLLVTVAVVAPADVMDPSTVRTRLQHANGWLRTEVAAAIHRRHAPELAWFVAVL